MCFLFCVAFRNSTGLGVAKCSWVWCQVRLKFVGVVGGIGSIGAGCEIEEDGVALLIGMLPEKGSSKLNLGSLEVKMFGSRSGSEVVSQMVWGWS